MPKSPKTKPRGRRGGRVVYGALGTIPIGKAHCASFVVILLAKLPPSVPTRSSPVLKLMAISHKCMLFFSMPRYEASLKLISLGSSLASELLRVPAIIAGTTVSFVYLP